MESGPVSTVPTPRKLIEEVANLPIVTSAAEKVGTTHGLLCRVVPLYGRLTSAALATTTNITQRAEQYQVVRTSVNKVEELGLKAVDSLKSSYPIIGQPTDEILDRLRVVVRQRVQLGSSRVAALRLSQMACRATEAAIGKVERVCNTSVQEEGGVLAHVLPESLQHVYSSAFQPLLTSAGHYLRDGRRAVRAWRRSGANISGKKEQHIRRRRKVTPRKKVTKTEWLVSWVPMSGWSWLGAAAASPPLASTLQMEGRSAQSQSPNKDIPSEEKKRKRSEEEPEMTFLDLLQDLAGYRSEDDPEYSPSDTSSDSWEYRSTDSEEREDTFTVEGSVEKRQAMANGAEDAAAAAPHGQEMGAVTPPVTITVTEFQEPVSPSQACVDDNLA